MAKSINDVPLSTREARKRLNTGLHWRSLDPEVHLGYRKAKQAGVWLVRWRNGLGYRQVTIGPADDAIGIGTLDYRSAIKAARKEVEAARTEAKALADGPVQTIRVAVESYIAGRDARDSSRMGRPIRSDAARKLEKYVIGRPQRGGRTAVAAAPLADIALHQLTEQNLLDWRTSLPTSLKATAVRRLTSDLKAALNSGFEKYRAKLPATLPAVVKWGLRAELADEEEDIPLARENQILSDREIVALLEITREVDAQQNWEGDLFRLVVVLAATGARFSQVARLKVLDVQHVNRRFMMPASRKGRGGKRAPIPVPAGQDVLDALECALVGRRPDEFLLERWRYVQKPGSILWHQSERGGWQTPSEMVRPWHIIRERAGLPAIVPYTFRHSSIVRGIRANLPLRLVAALHDTSVAMIERHYARYIADGLDALASQAVIPLVPQLDREPLADQSVQSLAAE